ncbi:MAG: Ca-activated chloride channel family protein, partial [Verrucomicrobiales bacterium]
MSPFGFTALSGAWLFLLIPPLILFYFLKLKRPRVEIPSLVFWQQVLQDSRVNAPFQKFKRNLMLFLQLLLLLLLILAAMQPFWRGNAGRAQRLPILIDISASMDAGSEDTKGSQLDEAKKRVGQRIDRLLRGQKICLISFGDRAKKLTPFTDNKRILKTALDNLTVLDVPGNPEDALRMAQALNSREPFDEVLMMSDGNFPERSDFELSYTLDYERLPPAGPNAGITSLNARRSDGLSWDVFVNVEGNPAFEVNATIHVDQDGQEIDRQAISLEPGSAERLIFQVPGEVETTLSARLVPQGFDALTSDNTA